MEITNACKKILKGQLGLIEGCCLLSRLRFEVKESESDLFHCFRVVDCKADYFPLGVAREKLSQEYVDKCDSELKVYLVEMKPKILDACKRLISFYQEDI